MDSFTTALIERTKEFAKEVDSLTFSLTQYVYNPLIYAWQMHKEYLRRYVHQHIPIYFLGMNPGPFGMAQTGVPFGEVHMVKEWMKIEEPIGEPDKMHPKRPVLGLNVKRSKVSGKRVWSL